MREEGLEGKENPTFATKEGWRAAGPAISQKLMLYCPLVVVLQ